VVGITCGAIENNARRSLDLHSRDLEERKRAPGAAGLLPLLLQPRRSGHTPALELRGDAAASWSSKSSWRKEGEAQAARHLLQVTVQHRRAGNYTDPDFGQLLLENLATRNRFAGDD